MPRQHVDQVLTPAFRCSMTNPIETLYICYFGLREPLVQTQVLPYLRELAKGGYKVSLLTFEPTLRKGWSRRQVDETRTELARSGIEWHLLAYHKRPSSIVTAWDILQGVRFVRKKIRSGVGILHGRVHVATLMGALARKLTSDKPKLIFDIRGFFPEEYVEAGVWPRDGVLYRAAKRVERWLVKESDGFVVLTQKAREVFFPPDFAKPVEVIPCCVDFEQRFRTGEDVTSPIKVDDRYVIAHVGALEGLYMADEIVAFLTTVRRCRPDLFALLLTQTDPQRVTGSLRACGFTDKDYFVGRVAAKDVPAYLKGADAGLSFVKASYATQSRSPTKIPEYLAAGIPVIANRGVGDVDKLIDENHVGVLIETFDEAAYLQAFDELFSLKDVSERCRATAMREFDLRTVGSSRYLRLYENVLKNGSQ